MVGASRALTDCRRDGHCVRRPLGRCGRRHPVTSERGDIPASSTMSNDPVRLSRPSGKPLPTTLRSTRRCGHEHARRLDLVRDEFRPSSIDCETPSWSPRPPTPSTAGLLWSLPRCAGSHAAGVPPRRFRARGATASCGLSLRADLTTSPAPSARARQPPDWAFSVRCSPGTWTRRSRRLPLSAIAADVSVSTNDRRVRLVASSEFQSILAFSRPFWAPGFGGAGSS